MQIHERRRATGTLFGIRRCLGAKSWWGPPCGSECGIGYYYLHGNFIPSRLAPPKAEVAPQRLCAHHGRKKTKTRFCFLPKPPEAVCASWPNKTKTCFCVQNTLFGHFTPCLRFMTVCVCVCVLCACLWLCLCLFVSVSVLFDTVCLHLFRWVCDECL